MRKYFTLFYLTVYLLLSQEVEARIDLISPQLNSINIEILNYTKSDTTDSLIKSEFNAFSSSIDSTDTTIISEDSIKTKGDIDSVIYSTAKDSLIFNLKNKKMFMYGSGDLRYKETILKSGKIDIDFETSNVEAFGYGIDTVANKEKETPVFSDKGENYTGTRMKYNFKTTKGYITYASTEMDNTSYSGAKIKKVSKDILFVENGVYTTCEAEEPHYCFVGYEMKVIQKEQMVGKWVWLTFGGVPFPIPLPFVVFPLQSGRRSGLIPPALGDRADYGRYFSNFGYFWAINDYMDANLTADYYMKGGYSLSSRFRYTQLYSFSGHVEGGFSNLHKGEITDSDRSEQQDWRLRWIHNQTLTPTSRFDVNMEFISSDYISQNSSDYNQLLRNEIVSNATYYKTWEEFGSSLSLNYSRSQVLETGKISEYLPSISFSKSQFYPFKSKKRIGDEKWYEQFGVNYSGQLQNRRIKEEGNLAVRGGVSHSVGFGFSPKVGFISINPNLSYRELWYNKRIEIVPGKSAATGNDTTFTNDVKELGFVRTFSTGVSASTKLYGIVQPNTIGIAAVRHTVIPGISYNYQPDFSEDKWGYYGSYQSSTGEIIKYNKYAREIFGGAGAGESQSLGFRLDNIFEMKTMVDPRDTTAKESKIQLLNLAANMNYNFAADSLRFSDLSLSYRTQITDIISFQGSSTYSLYKYDLVKKTDVNRFLLSENEGFLRLKNFNFSISTQISGDRLKPKDAPKAEGEKGDNINNTENLYLKENSGYKGLYEDKEADFTIPWSISLNYNYSLSKNNPLEPSTYQTLSGNLNFNLTPNWKFSASGSYDLEKHQFAAPQVMISRDLHCWIMNFTWNPIGSYRGYRFEIRVKAPQLQDLKVTKSDNFFSGKR